MVGIEFIQNFGTLDIIYNRLRPQTAPLVFRILRVVILGREWLNIGLIRLNNKTKADWQM